jgi:DNA-binding HxlR family transcriptional regulator
MPSDRRKSIYRLTEKGLDLAPLLVEMMLWSARYEHTAAPAADIRKMKHHREEFLRGIREQWKAGKPRG